MYRKHLLFRFVDGLEGHIENLQQNSTNLVEVIGIGVIYMLEHAHEPEHVDVDICIGGQSAATP